MPLPGVMVAGEKTQLRVLGMPLQESAMELLKVPDCVCTLTVKVPVLPEGMMTDAGDALKDKVGDGGGGGGGGGAVVAEHDGL